MKNKVLLFCCLLIILFSEHSFTQYKSIFGDDTTSWRFFNCIADASGTVLFYSHNDTVIKSVKYHKIYRQLLFNLDDLIGNGEIYGFVNENTTTGKYLFLPLGEENPHTFIDMGLNKGDTFLLYNSVFNRVLDTLTVDTVYFSDDDRKIIELNYNLHCWEKTKMLFIEGVGTNNGFYPIDDPDKFLLLCKYDSLIYISPSNTEKICYVERTGSVKTFDLDIDIKVFPNPSKKTVTIQIRENIDYELFCKAYNSMGKMVSIQKINTSTFKIDFESRGIYYIIITDLKRIASRKIIIE